MLVENKEQLDEWAASSFEPDRVSLLQERVTIAREELAAAEENTEQSTTLSIRIDQARLVADFQELSLAYYESVNVFFQVISEAQSFGDNELHQRAADSFVEAQAVLEDARTVIEDMGILLSEIDTGALDEPELEYTGDPLDHLDLEDRRALDGAESYALGYENIHLAFVHLEAGQGHYENEEFIEARKEWETGQERATEAKSEFEAAVDNDHLPQNLNEESIRLIGTAETVIEAFDNFVQGAREAEAGNLEEANTLVTEGFSLLEEL
ncbi:hypothetical protein SAMN05192561_10219 [Halopenitus malekzadehii]|uniref:Uncharacterized protein n=2 Tax=Halopenitus malekzadehii TaxID=1267564 RepID=A0A1H6I9I4_9EURY|nr:hypothetical protein SAMN05192561_10219 [Halopenitus malekzadehii]